LVRIARKGEKVTDADRSAAQAAVGCDSVHFRGMLAQELELFVEELDVLLDAL